MGDGEILTTISLQLGKVQGSVEGLRGEVKGVRADLRSLNDKVDLMPDRWESDVKVAVESCRSQRDEITNVANLAKERERARADGSLPSKRKRDSWLPSVVKDTLRPFITLLIAGAIFGAISLAVGKCGDDETQKQIEQVQTQLKQMKVNGGLTAQE